MTVIIPTMSTFKGIVAEFPQIRIDYFRHQPGHKAPLACFLSHVHSDHLAGLESLRAPFVYCSSATREVRIYVASKLKRPYLCTQVSVVCTQVLP